MRHDPEIQLNTMQNSTDRLLQFAQQIGAIKFGDFTLSSGEKSNRYFEGKLLTLHPEGSCLIGEAIYNILTSIEIDAIGGLIIGAIPIATAVSMLSYQKGRPMPAFIVRDKQKEHGTKRLIEGHLKEGQKVAIVDDVITYGGSVERAIREVETMGCQVVKVITIVDRLQGGSEKLKAEGYDFSALIDFLPDGTLRNNVTGKIERNVTA
jgi:orotate phosphoribosyltransferase